MVDVEVIKANLEIEKAAFITRKASVKKFLEDTHKAVEVDEDWKKEIMKESKNRILGKYDDIVSNLEAFKSITTDNSGNDRETELRLSITQLTERLKQDVTDLKAVDAVKTNEEIQTLIDNLSKEADDESTLKKKNSGEKVNTINNIVDEITKELDDYAGWVVPRPVDEVKKAAKIVEDKERLDLIADIAKNGKPWAVPSDEEIARGKK